METKLLNKNNHIVRVLESSDDGNMLLIIDCIRMTMPVWMPLKEYEDYISCGDNELYQYHKLSLEEMGEVEIQHRCIMHQRYSIIARVLPYIDDTKRRAEAIKIASKQFGVSTKTVRDYLCKYLVFQDMRVLLPRIKRNESNLTTDEKNMRWALNKYFYTREKNTLKTAYTLMLKAKYCDEMGILLEKYPSFYQFRYFYRKTRKMQNFYISRDGLSDYQRNHRPCTGDGIQEFAPAPGTGMVDGTVLDIYLINDAGQVVGRPVLLACIDAYSYFCYGYALVWEGGIYAIRELMRNVLTDKRNLCREHGIEIESDVWPSVGLPGVLVSDQGSEYVGETFSQLSELGITIENLPSYRPELKGMVEKFFDLIQDRFKPQLKGKGVIDVDFRERGAPDYRKDACLTLQAFEEIILRCILHYNSQWIIQNYPMTPKMLDDGIKPYAVNIFKWGLHKAGANIVSGATSEDVALCLLPRTIGLFTRNGLHVNKLKYYAEGFTERYLVGGEATVAFSENTSFVWLVEDGRYTRFNLVENRFEGMTLDKIQAMKRSQKEIVRNEQPICVQSDIDLARHIENIALRYQKDSKKADIKGIGETRKHERAKTHIDQARKEGLYGEG